jgi:UDP-4-amino-4,6-dideoxy-N-acetyl-beta-L-altrosamine transaminase
MGHSFIPYGRQSVDEEDIRAVVEVLKSDFLTTGPKVEEFEKKVASYVGCKYAVSVANGTAALHAACFAANINEEDEVITTPMTFAASSNCILYTGGTPVFADIDPITYNINPIEIEKKITKKTKAIIAVDFTGQPAELFKIKEIAEKNNLIFIEDAAHSLGSEIKNLSGVWQKIGSIAQMTTFSFHPVKHITTAEGGMICTDDKKLFERLKIFRTHGITREINLLQDKSRGKWYYEQQFLGYNYRLSDMQAALGISQLGKLDKFINRRREIVYMYNKAFGESDFQNRITVPYEDISTKTAYHIYIVRFNMQEIGKSREKIMQELLALNIGVNIHYIPVYYHPYYQALGYKKGLCKVAENLYEEMCTLPLYQDMSDEDVDYVIDCVRKVIL